MADYPGQHRVQTLGADQRFDMRLWLAWVAAVTMGWAVDWAVGWVVVEVVSRVSPDAIWAAFLFHGPHVVGIGVALLQALVLRRRLAQAAWWILATGVAAVFGELIRISVTGAVYDAMVEIDAAFLTSIALSILAGGLLVGAAQWLILRRLVERAGWWIPASGLGLIAGWLLGAFVGSIVAEYVLDSPNDLKAFELVAELVGAIIYAAITGYALVRLLQSRALDADDARSALR